MPAVSSAGSCRVHGRSTVLIIGFMSSACPQYRRRVHVQRMPAVRSWQVWFLACSSLGSRSSTCTWRWSTSAVAQWRLARGSSRPQPPGHCPWSTWRQCSARSQQPGSAGQRRLACPRSLPVSWTSAWRTRWRRRCKPLLAARFQVGPAQRQPPVPVGGQRRPAVLRRGPPAPLAVPLHQEPPGAARLTPAPLAAARFHQWCSAIGVRRLRWLSSRRMNAPQCLAGMRRTRWPRRPAARGARLRPPGAGCSSCGMAKMCRLFQSSRKTSASWAPL